MQFQTLAVIAFAALAAAVPKKQHKSEIDMKGDVPKECQQNLDCEKFINVAATCPRDIDTFQWIADKKYKNCVCARKTTYDHLQSCYTYLLFTDIKKIFEICTSHQSHH